MNKQSNPTDVDVQCKRMLFDIENKIDLMLTTIKHTNQIITAWLSDPINKRS